MNSNPQLNIHFPGRLVFGRGLLEPLAEEIVQMRLSKILMVTISPLLPKLKGFVERLEGSGMTVHVDTGIAQEPSFDDFKLLMQPGGSF